jgi:hypothetical protein
MLDLDTIVAIRTGQDFESPRSKKNLETAVRQNQKILLEATNKSVDYITERNKLGSSFEALFRSLGLGAGVVLGGPIGAATLSSLAGGVGRGVGEYFGNKVYGQAIDKMEDLMSNYKYKQLINNFAISEVKGQIKLTDEFYKQAEAEITKTIQDVAPQ